MKFIFLLFLIFTACGSSEETDTTSEGDATLIIGEGEIFTTTELTAPSGGVITILNQDSTPHTVTSESSAGAFDDTGDFNVLVASDGEGLLTLPEAASGTIFYYYCRLHEEAMTPAGGTITIE